jgi:very-short-patch-repair endonuclease
MNNDSQNRNQQNSPPLKGGVPAGWGGFQVYNLKNSAHLQPPRQRSVATPPLEEGVFLFQQIPHTLFTNEQPQNARMDTKKAERKRINNLPHLKTFRRKLRKNLTPAEAAFWNVVKNRNLEGRKFRRQHSVGNYILDFYCPTEKLAIELDGEVHFCDEARIYDYERRLFLEYFGIKVLRFENRIVFEELHWMIGVIKSNFGWSEE